MLEAGIMSCFIDPTWKGSFLKRGNRLRHIMTFDVNFPFVSVSCNFDIATCRYCRVLVVKVLFEGWETSKVLLSELNAV